MDTNKTLKNEKFAKAYGANPRSVQEQLICNIAQNVNQLYTEQLPPDMAHLLHIAIQEELNLLLEREQEQHARMYEFVESIRKMNLAFAPITCYNTKLTNLGQTRLVQFHAIICKEVEELGDVFDIGDPDSQPDYTALADCLGDLVVFIFSEAARWGIPLLEVLSIIMDSQASKLVDGKPIPHPTEPGKFGKGPNYFPPEDKIRALLENYK